MLKNGKAKEYNLCYDGCSCHNSKKTRKKVKHSLKKREQKQWQKQEKNDN